MSDRRNESAEDRRVSLRQGSEHELVRTVQKRLKEAGFDPGEGTGVFDTQTRKAVAEFQLQHDLDATGVVDEAVVDALEIEVSEAERAVAAPEFERENFRYLLAKNPNYFGNLPESEFEAVEEFERETAYEELTCVGYEPTTERLEAVVHVKRDYGYGGDICSSGTPEYVRFYVDWENDGTWEDVGMASFTAYDIPGDKPLEYGVSLQLDPDKKFCTVENLPNVRAILSWNHPPPANSPNYPPVWGNVLDSRIQIDALSVASLGDLFDEYDLHLPDSVLAGLDASQTLSFQAPSLGVTELATRYEDTSVPPHRFAASHLQQVVDDPTLVSELDEQAPLAPLLDLDFDVDLSDFVDDLLEHERRTYYEELDCVGLTREGLNAVFTLKRPNGYSGDLCTAGSQEYVAFWEWDQIESTWVHLGTTSTNVHDIRDVPGDGLQYAAFLPEDLGHLRRPCAKGPRTARIRATLSWEIPPPPSDPYWTPVWGNSTETRVHVSPGPTPDGTVGYVETVGNVAVCDIDKSTGLASGSGVLAGFTANESPFGGLVTVSGIITNAPHVLDGESPMKYRVSVRPYDPSKTDAENPWQPLRNEFDVTVTEKQGSGPPTQYKMTQSTDSDGFYTYREDSPPGDWRYVAGRVLARWQTRGDEGRWEIKLETKAPGDSPVPAGVLECADGSTRGTVVVRLDNTRPDADIEITSVEHDDGSTDPADECGKFVVGDVVHGTYEATDEHFGRLRLGVQPSSHAHGASIDPSSRSYPTVPTSGESGTWELDTDGMDPCGYIARLHVEDRTIVNSGHIGWEAADPAGFCLEASTETDGGAASDVVADPTAVAGGTEDLAKPGEPSLAVAAHEFDSPGDDHENLNDEYVTIENTGDTDVEMTGWSVEDDAGHTYAFPDGFTLAASASVTVRTGSGDDTATDLYWGSERAIWDNTGDSVFLYDDDGALVLKRSY